MNDGQIFDVQALKRAIIENTGPGKKFTRRKLSLEASGGKNPDLVRDFLSRGQDRKPTLETVAGIANALNVDVGNFLVSNLGSTDPGVERVAVIGAVEAGAWRQQDEWEPDRQYEVEVYPTQIRGAVRFGLEVVGYSMDKLFLPGTILDCVAVPATPDFRPVSGDIVVVQRKMGDLTETTCKRLEQLPDGSYQLRAESTRPEFAEPIPIGRPDNGHFGDDETRIIGVVNSAITRVLRR